LEHLLSAWSEVAEQLRGARHILLLLDYDGTLTPIVERPELADLPEGTRRLLEALAGKQRLRLAIISGRALADLKQKVAIGNIIYAGNHGLEIEGRGFSFVSPVAEEAKPLLRQIYGELSQALGAIKGVLVEDKGLTLSVHYRQVAEGRSAEVRSIFEHITGDAARSGKIGISGGKKVYEVRPAVAWDKGKVVEMLVGKESGTLPIYLGDDLSDEDGFKAVENYGGGISVFVGEMGHDTSARYFLASPDAVAKFLSLLLEETQ
jgi:trehalose 6-phosphate phosphatase